MEIEWDTRKDRANQRKQGLHLADAASILHDELALTIVDERAGEERFVTVGSDLLGRVLTAIFTWRGDRARIISARKATARERRDYEEQR